nr:ATP8 [Donax trunculus]
MPQISPTFWIIYLGLGWVFIGCISILLWWACVKGSYSFKYKLLEGWKV